jgi:hypothetical protein
MDIFKTKSHAVVIIPLKDAMLLGVLLDACMDTVGNIEARDVDLTPKQLSRAEDNMQTIATELQRETT